MKTANGHRAQATNMLAPDPAMGGIAIANAPVFSQGELEQLAWRRFNPLSQLTALTLTAALDAYSVGLPAQAARLWAEICRRDETISSVKSKREEAVALRDWTVTPLDDSPAAADQAAALRNFYGSIRAGAALNRHAVGGFPLLVTQMMEAVSFGYAVHHFIWAPDAARTWKLPSGRVVPTLTAQAEYTPLEFFECRTGELRFLGMNQGITGQPLAPGAWMVTSAGALMMSASILHWYKRLALHDLVNFSEKFGTPGLVIHTTAGQGSPEGQNALALARQLAGNYRGVQYGAPENKVEVIWPSGGSGSGNLPMTGIIEDVRRELAILYLGADLSTMSRGGQSVGASIQGEEQAKRERADCARISETLNATLDPLVLRWYFGDAAPVLAKVSIEAPVNEDRSALWNLVAGMAGLGARVPVAEIASRLNIPVSPGGPEFFAEPASPEPPIPNQGAAAQAENAEN
jgi:phage gp29-like protein